MAFDKSKFTSVAAQTLSNNAEMHWLYETQDSAEAIKQTGANQLNSYFAEVHSLLSEGNIITVRHMSTPEEGSRSSTVVDEIDYIVLHKGEHRDENGRVVKDVFVYPLETGQRIMFRKFDNATSFTNKDISFQSIVCASKIGIVRLQKLVNNLTLTLKQKNNTGAELGIVNMSAENSAKAGYYNETDLGSTSRCVEKTFNVTGSAPANSSVPFLMYIVAESSEAAHVDQLCLNASVSDANDTSENPLRFVSPVNGFIKRMDVIASANADGGTKNYTLKINNSSATNGVAEIKEGAKKAYATPTGQNAVKAGDEITVEYDALGAAGKSSVSILIEK